MIFEFNTFASRLQIACETGEPAEIARITGLTYQTVKNYLEGRLPTADVLLKLSDTLGVSIHWLLTGTGTRFIEQSSTVVEDWLAENERKVIQEIAKTGGISFEEAVAQLVREALAMKGFGEMPGVMPIPVFNMIDEDIDARIFSHLDHLPKPTRQAETQRLIGALVTRAAAP